MIKKLSLILLVFSFALAACAPKAPRAGTLKFTDDLGREITLKGPAQRIVSLAPSNTEILFAIGAAFALPFFVALYLRINMVTGASFSSCARSSMNLGLAIRYRLAERCGSGGVEGGSRKRRGSAKAEMVAMHVRCLTQRQSETHSLPVVFLTGAECGSEFADRNFYSALCSLFSLCALW